MTIFNEPHGRMIDANSGSVLRLFGIAAAAFVVVIMLFSSVARVDSGNVGVLTLFGRVTGEVLPEGVHLINPFKSNHELSIRTQELKESASVPSSEGLMINLDTSLIYHLNPEKAAEVLPEDWPQLPECADRAKFAGGHPGGHRRPLRQRAVHRRTGNGRRNRFLTSSPRNSGNVACWWKACCCVTFSCPRL